MGIIWMCKHKQNPKEKAKQIRMTSMSTVDMPSDNETEMPITTPISVSMNPVTPRSDFDIQTPQSQGAFGGEEYVNDEDDESFYEEDDNDEDEIYDNDELYANGNKGHTSGNTIGSGMNLSGALELNEDEFNEGNGIDDTPQ